MIDLSLSEDSQSIVDAATDLLGKVAPLDRLRAPGGDDALFALLAEWGWFAMGVAAEQEGFGLGAGEQALIWTEAGRHLVAPSVLATALAARFGPDSARNAMQAGAQRAAFVIADGAGGHFGLEPSGAEWLVEIAADGLHFHPASSFAGKPAEPFDEALETVRGQLGGTPAFVADDGGMAGLLVAALLAGAAGGAADLAIEYAGTREQFGQPIGAFQAVKHRCADMGVAGFGAQAQVTLAAAAMEEGAEEAGLELAAAIAQATKSALANARGAIQVHGGMGFTDECHAHRFIKRSHVLGLVLGRRRDQTAQLLTLG